MAKQPELSSLPPDAATWSPTKWDQSSQKLTATLSRNVAPEIRKVTVDLSGVGGNITVEGITPENQTKPTESNLLTTIKIETNAHTRWGAERRLKQLVDQLTIETAERGINITQESTEHAPTEFSSRWEKSKAAWAKRRSDSLRNHSKLDLWLQVPSTDNIINELDTMYGTIKTSNTQGSTRATVYDEGDVSASFHSGDFDGETERGIASVYGSEGAVRVHSNNGKAIAGRITGSVDASATDGNVQVFHVDGPSVSARVETGMIKLENIDADQIDAEIAKKGDIYLYVVRGAVSSTTKKGYVQASDSMFIGPSNKLVTGFGYITAYTNQPPESSYKIAHTHDGHVERIKVHLGDPSSMDEFEVTAGGRDKRISLGYGLEQ